MSENEKGAEKSQKTLPPSPVSGYALPASVLWQPGQSANPGGRPKVERTVSRAIAELQDTPGATPEACIKAYKKARGAKLCGADHKAIALYRTECAAKERTQVGAVGLALDRLEGKVAQAVEVTGGLDLASAIAAAQAAASEEKVTPDS